MTIHEPPPFKVTLTQAEVYHAAVAGVGRHVKNLYRPDSYGKVDDDNWAADIEGASAEMAFAKSRNVYWDPVWGVMQPERGDVGDYQIRSTRHSHGCLLLHPKDLDDAFYVLVTGASPVFTFVGGLLGREGKLDVYWADRASNGRPAFFVPQRALKGIPYD